VRLYFGVVTLASSLTENGTPALRRERGPLLSNTWPGSRRTTEVSLYSWIEANHVGKMRESESVVTREVTGYPVFRNHQA